MDGIGKFLIVKGKKNLRVYIRSIKNYKANVKQIMYENGIFFYECMDNLKIMFNLKILFNTNIADMVFYTINA